MNMASQMGGKELVVQVLSAPDSDEEELAELTTLLRADLLELDVAAVDPVAQGQAPDQAKGAVAAVAGWLTVNLGREALRAVVGRVAAWAARSNSTVEITLGGDVLKVTGVSPDQQNRLIDEWIRRQASSP
jgi:hypothetical protein